MSQPFSKLVIHGIALTMMLTFSSQGRVMAQDTAASDTEPGDTGELNNEIVDASDTNDDDTADIDTESTVDTISADAQSRFQFRGDFRPLYTRNERDRRDETTTTNSQGQFRLRLKGTALVKEGIQVGTRLAWRCESDDCGMDWIAERAIPGNNGLEAGQATFDELYAHFFRQEKFNVTVGRQQTRFVLRGGVFARSLDRNDSNNTNVTWTDGFHATLRNLKGRNWETHLIMQKNSADGSGSIRRGLLDFSSSAARQTYFIATENTNQWGPVVQRALDISYLPDSLLVDGTDTGRRENYLAIVGRLAMRWPLGSGGAALRAGMELGYAPETPTSAAVDIDADVDGLAWNVAVSLMEFRPRHNIGVNYGQTGAGWLLSPNFRENEELFEIRYQWRPANFPAIDVRLRLREDIEQLTSVLTKQRVVDAFIRLTWQVSR